MHDDRRNRESAPGSKYRSLIERCRHFQHRYASLRHASSQDERAFPAAPST